MKKMRSILMSTIDYPNTFQSPNSIIDDGIMALLNGNETKCLFACQRRILGWEKHRATRQDRISVSQLVKMTGLSSPTVVKAMKILNQVNLVKRIQDNLEAHHPDGTLWELNMSQLGDIDTDTLQARKDKRSHATHDKMEKARDARQPRGDNGKVCNDIKQGDSVMPLHTTPQCHYIPPCNGITTQNTGNPIKHSNEEKTSSLPGGEKAPPPELPAKTKTPRKKKSDTDPRVKPLLVEFEKLVGYPLPNYGQEGTAAKLMLKTYQPKDILACWKYMQKDNDFWKDKHCGLSSVNKQIGKWLEGQNTNGGRIISL